MPVIVTFDDILATVFEVSVTEQKAQASVVEVVLVISLDGIGDEGEANLIDGAMPAGAGIIGAYLKGLVHFGVGEGFMLALVPTEAAKHAQILG